MRELASDDTALYCEIKSRFSFYREYEKGRMTDNCVNVYSEPVFCVKKITCSFFSVPVYRCIYLCLCLSTFCNINVYADVYPSWCVNICVCVCSYSMRAVNGREFSF